MAIVKTFIGNIKGPKGDKGDSGSNITTTSQLTNNGDGTSPYATLTNVSEAINNAINSAIEGSY